MKKYIVAKNTDGFLCCPEYENFQIIEANNEEDALKLYEEKNNCNFYFNGVVLCEYNTKLNWLIGYKPISQDVVKHILEMV